MYLLGLKHKRPVINFHCMENSSLKIVSSCETFSHFWSNYSFKQFVHWFVSNGIQVPAFFSKCFGFLQYGLVPGKDNFIARFLAVDVTVLVWTGGTLSVESLSWLVMFSNLSQSPPVRRSQRRKYSEVVHLKPSAGIFLTHLSNCWRCLA